MCLPLHRHSCKTKATPQDINMSDHNEPLLFSTQPIHGEEARLTPPISGLVLISFSGIPKHKKAGRPQIILSDKSITFG